MKDTDILFSIALMILGIVLMYKSMKGNSCRQRLAKLADSIASDKENINFQIKRFGYLLDEMAADNEKNSILKCHADRLEELVTQLDRTRNELEISNLSMADINGELKRSNAELVKRATQLRDEIQQDELAIQKMQERLDSLKRIKAGLEIALNNIQAEEVHYLSEPVFSLGITPSIKSHLESHGILYIGDLIHLNEQYLMEIWGVGPVTLEKIKTKLNENGAWFGMDVIRVGNHWYRIKQGLITD